MKKITEEKKSYLMYSINAFFDGDNYTYEPPKYKGSKYLLGVSKIDFCLLDNDEIDIVFTLSRPGLLIGKGGRTINSLTEYLSSENKVNIKIIEFDPWRI